MRVKKGFTLAEILIVLMVIGVIATMTIPSMMKGVTESQLKAGYKKAYNTIANFAAMERVSGSLPGKASANAVASIYKGMDSSLSVKGYAVQEVNAGSVIASGTSFYPCITFTGTTNGINKIGLGDDDDCVAAPTSNTDSAGGVPTTDEGTVWLITDDNIAYTVLQGGQDTKCETKQQIAAKTSTTSGGTDTAAAAASCAVIIADVDGLTKGQNMMELQGLADQADYPLAAGTDALTITGDQFKIYMGVDGASAGPTTTTITGRIAADIK